MSNKIEIIKTPQQTKLDELKTKPNPTNREIMDMLEMIYDLLKK